MKIIVPMAGVGDRFVNAGYDKIKPLIEVDGKPIIEHVVNMFPGEENFAFIVNRDHLNSTDIIETLGRLKPGAEIIPIAPHKLGPVHTVLEGMDAVQDDEPTIINYCDFSVWWDYGDFKSKVLRSGCDGCVTAYRGFHPNLLGDALYAGMRSDEQNNMLEIREKHSFTENKMDSYQSAGTYYFKSGEIIKKYFQRIIDKGASINGEYYISMAYQLMKEDGLDIIIYNLEHFLQWGTPEDLEEYVYWSDYFRRKLGGQVR